MITPTKMTRSAHGLDVGDDNPWWHRAACQADPDLFNAGNQWTPGWAVHICARHCPVLAACQADTRRQTPIGGIQAGLRWSDSLNPSRQGPSVIQPADAGCGHWCTGLSRSIQPTST